MATWNTDAQLAETIDEKFLATNSQLNSFLSDGVQGMGSGLAFCALLGNLLCSPEAWQASCSAQDKA